MSVEICSNDALVAHCFDCLVQHFSQGSMPPLPDPYGTSGIECPMFVTLHKATPRGLELRGCIGCLSPIPLTSINDYVFKSAFEDTRFPPLREDEVPSLDISFSVLTNFEQTNDHLDWEVLHICHGVVHILGYIHAPGAVSWRSMGSGSASSMTATDTPLRICLGWPWSRDGQRRRRLFHWCAKRDTEVIPPA